MGGANIYPRQVSDNGRYTINLGSPLRLGHRNGTKISDFDEQLKMLYGKYQAATWNLIKLLDTEILHPVNYEYQGRHYMATVNVNKVYFACLYGNNEDEFIIRYMERDLEVEEDMVAEEEYFLLENVKKRVEPDCPLCICS